MDKKKLYRIYTEDKNEQLIIELCNEYFDAYTLYYTVGYWKGKRELSLVIEIITEDMPQKYGKVQGLANEIKILNNQEAVLITEQEILCELI